MLHTHGVCLLIPDHQQHVLAQTAPSIKLWTMHAIKAIIQTLNSGQCFGATDLFVGNYA